MGSKRDLDEPDNPALNWIESFATSLPMRLAFWSPLLLGTMFTIGGLMEALDGDQRGLALILAGCFCAQVQSIVVNIRRNANAQN